MGVHRSAKASASQRQDIPFLVNGSVAAVPEPATVALWVLGLAGIAASAQRRRV